MLKRGDRQETTQLANDMAADGTRFPPALESWKCKGSDLGPPTSKTPWVLSLVNQNARLKKMGTSRFFDSRQQKLNLKLYQKDRSIEKGCGVAPKIDEMLKRILERASQRQLQRTGSAGSSLCALCLPSTESPASWRRSDRPGLAHMVSRDVV